MKKQTKKSIIIVVSCLIFMFSLVFLSYLFLPKITLKDGKIVEVNVNDSYKENVKATFQGKNVTKEMKKRGKVNTKKLGTYQISYVIKKGIFQTKAVQTVIVKDLEKPVIQLVGNTKVSVCKGKEFQELGFSAIDNVDGDLTSKVKVKKEKDKMIYQVQDKSKNQTEMVRKLVYEDKEAPLIQLLGGEVITLPFLSTYEESGFQASDNCDGDLTSKVKVIGNVDTSKLGEQELIYSVQDSEGNEATVKRQIRVVEREKIGTIYLTFDDGPKEGTTDVILDILKEEGVKATFFVTNGGPDYLIQRAASEGHTIALHTASHNYSYVYSSVENYFNDLQIVHDRVQRITGQDVRILRFPGGSSNTISRRYASGIMSTLTREVLQRGYHYFDWNLSSGDAGETNQKEGVYQNVVNQLSKQRRNIVLMHDIKPYTKDALREIIHYGKNNGYLFEAITNDTEMMTQRVNN